MPMPFDATMKDLVQRYPEAWLPVLDWTGSGPVVPVNVDLSTVTAKADVVLQEGEPARCLLHIDFQSGPDRKVPRRTLMYNGLLQERFDLPVHSIVVLLRREAELSNLTGRVQYQARPNRGGMDFRYEVVRLWEWPVEGILAGGLGTLPLAPLCLLPDGGTPEQALEGVIRRVAARLNQEAPPEDRPKLLTATFVLTGLRVSRETSIRLFQGVGAMRESTTYQFILDEGRAEGRAEGVRNTLLRQGHKRFGPADAATQEALARITDLGRLERMSERLLDVATWEELLATP
jgi:predicted transposase YdaD